MHGRDGYHLCGIVIRIIEGYDILWHCPFFHFCVFVLFFVGVGDEERGRKEVLPDAFENGQFGEILFMSISRFRKYSFYGEVAVFSFCFSLVTNSFGEKDLTVSAYVQCVVLLLLFCQ